MSHNCPTCRQCRQALIPIHPTEVKRAISFLRFLAKNPRATHPGSKTPYHNTVIEGGQTWQNLVMRTAREIPEPSFKLWHTGRETAEYARLRGIELNAAAEKLADGWLPPGHVIDKDKDLSEECEHKQTEEYVPDPNGNVSVGEFGKPPVQCRRVVTKIPESERLHTGFYCPLSTEPF